MSKSNIEGWQIVHRETDDPPQGMTTYELYSLEDCLDWLGGCYNRSLWRLLPCDEGAVEEPTLCGRLRVHREIDCPLCEGPLCDLDGDGPNPPKEIVFTLTYTHKHGSDVGVYRTYKGAADAAYGLASERVEEWDDEEQKAEFAAFGDEEVALDYFHDVEMECSYSEILEITKTELQS